MFMLAMGLIQWGDSQVEPLMGSNVMGNQHLHMVKLTHLMPMKLGL